MHMICPRGTMINRVVNNEESVIIEMLTLSG